MPLGISGGCTWELRLCDWCDSLLQIPCFGDVKLSATVLRSGTFARWRCHTLGTWVTTWVGQCYYFGSDFVIWRKWVSYKSLSLAFSLSPPSLLPAFCHGITWKESPAQTGHGCWTSRSTELLEMHLFTFFYPVSSLWYSVLVIRSRFRQLYKCFPHEMWMNPAVLSCSTEAWATT